MNEASLLFKLIVLLYFCWVSSQQSPFCNGISSSFRGEDCFSSNSFTDIQCPAQNCCVVTSSFSNRCIQRPVSLQIPYYNKRDFSPTPTISPKRATLFHGGVSGFPGSVMIRYCNPIRGNIIPCKSLDNRNYSRCMENSCCWGPIGCYGAWYFVVRLRRNCEPGFGNPPKCEEINECASNPCLNDGTCRDLLNEFKCDCPDGTSGDRCELGICRAPTVEFAVTNSPGPFNTGDQVVYSCIGGYVLVGNNTLVCQIDGTFKPNPPRCLRECVTGPPLNPFVNFTSTNQNDVFLTGDVVTYFCDDGKIIPPNSTLNRCDNDGNWINPAPTCYDCNAPPQAINGAYTPNENFFMENDVVTYECPSLSLLVGNSTNTCQIGNNWSNSPPVCNSSVCPVFPPLQNGEIIYSQGNASEPAALGVVANVSCNEGFALNAETDSHICQNTLGVIQWSPVPTPICLRGCELPSSNPPLIYESITPSAIAVPDGFGILVSCEDGFHLDGTVFYSCNASDPVSFPNLNQSQCLPNCGQPPEPLNGSALLTINFPPDTAMTYDPGTIAFYTCNTTLKEGEPTSTCGQGGNWSALFYICKTECLSIVSPNGSTPNPNPNDPNTSVFEGDVVEFICDVATQTLDFGNTTTCQTNGTFFPDPALFQPCRETKCPPPDLPDNGDTVEQLDDAYDPGTSVTFQCDEGFAFEGNLTTIPTTCLINLTWTVNGSSLNCLPACSSTFPNVANAVILRNPDGSSPYPLGTELLYRCVDGSNTLNDDQLEFTCTSSGDGPAMWTSSASNISEICLPSCNSTYPIVANAVVDIEPIGFQPYFAGAQLVYRCEPGYNASDSSELTFTCSGNGGVPGMWISPASDINQICTPACNSSYPVLPNAEPETNGSFIFPIGQELQYRCNRGFGATAIIVLTITCTSIAEGPGFWVADSPVSNPICRRMANMIFALDDFNGLGCRDQDYLFQWDFLRRFVPAWGEELFSDTGSTLAVSASNGIGSYDVASCRRFSDYSDSINHALNAIQNGERLCNGFTPFSGLFCANHFFGLNGTTLSGFRPTIPTVYFILFDDLLNDTTISEANNNLNMPETDAFLPLVDAVCTVHTGAIFNTRTGEYLTRIATNMLSKRIGQNEGRYLGSFDDNRNTLQIVNNLQTFLERLPERQP